MRILLDTNTIVSGLLYPGKPRKLINLVIDGKADLVSSIKMIDELKEVLSRKKFGLDKEDQTAMVDFVIRLSHITVLKSRFKIVKDPDDDMVVNTAHDGRVSYIVSGDHHLLDLKEFSGIKIVTANQMLELL